MSTSSGDFSSPPPPPKDPNPHFSKGSEQDPNFLDGQICIFPFPDPDFINMDYFANTALVFKLDLNNKSFFSSRFFKQPS